MIMPQQVKLTLHGLASLLKSVSAQSLAHALRLCFAFPGTNWSLCAIMREFNECDVTILVSSLELECFVEIESQKLRTY